MQRSQGDTLATTPPFPEKKEKEKINEKKIVILFKLFIAFKYNVNHIDKSKY